MNIINVNNGRESFDLTLSRDEIGLLAHGLYSFKENTVGERKIKQAKLLRSGLLEVLKRYGTTWEEERQENPQT